MRWWRLIVFSPFFYWHCGPCGRRTNINRKDKSPPTLFPLIRCDVEQDGEGLVEAGGGCCGNLMALWSAVSVGGAIRGFPSEMCAVYLDTVYVWKWLEVKKLKLWSRLETIWRPDRQHVGQLLLFCVVLSLGRKQAPRLLKYLHKAVTLLDLFGVNIAFPGQRVSFVDRACQTSHKEGKGRGVIPPVTVEQMEWENTLAGGGVRQGGVENVESKTAMPKKQRQTALIHIEFHRFNVNQWNWTNLPC